MVDEELMSYRHEAVRALAWAIRAPNLIIPQPGLNFQCAATLRTAYAEAEPWLRRLETDPTPLVDTLKALNTWKVGVYFEALLGFWLSNHPELTLLAHNPQVRDQGRTLGAFDFLIRDPKQHCIHWEVAVKFYLQRHHSADWSAWVGPNLRDRLDLKLHRMRDHQLPLARTAAGQACLETYGITNLHAQHAVLKGTVFTPWGAVDGPRAPDGLSPEGERGLWLSVNELDAYLDTYPTARWYRREKPDWLGPAVKDVEATLDRDSFRLNCRGTPLKRPQLWSRMVETGSPFWGQEQLVFLVPGDWSTPPSLKDR